VGVESLEGKQLLSLGGGLGSVLHAAEVQRAEDHGHDNAFTGSERVTKAPSFYEFYTGPKRGGLNVVQAGGEFDARHQTLVLTGTMQAKINTKPANESQESYYVFGLNRGGQAVAPFFMRPGVRFDSVVVVSVESEVSPLGST